MFANGSSFCEGPPGWLLGFSPRLATAVFSFVGIPHTSGWSPPPLGLDSSHVKTSSRLYRTAAPILMYFGPCRNKRQRRTDATDKAVMRATSCSFRSVSIAFSADDISEPTFLLVNAQDSESINRTWKVSGEFWKRC